MNEDAAQVLIVDDEINLRESLAELVESEGFRASQAANGEEAVQVLRAGATRPDVVFLDMRMPKLDGLGVLRLIQEEKLTDAPVVVISAFGDSSKMIEAMRLGAYDYITKPLDLDETVAILR
ncbi:MAG TPA: response regulator, partial [Pyrinomonadaceae bacterium]|nr:response regulator [Pyrinomonadaceae bacterium]